MATSIISDNGTATKSTCAICMSGEKSVQSHNCNVCTKDAWVICNDCNSKVNNCPVCRAPMNQTNTTIIININNTIPNNNTRSEINWNEIFKCIYYFLRIPTIFICSVYLGKVYIYMYCKGTCKMDDEGKPDDCLCYHFIIRDKYWADFKYCIGEFLSGVIVSAIVFSCCCLKK